MLSALYATQIPLSVRLYVTRVDCIKTAERIIEILSLSDRLIIVFFIVMYFCLFYFYCYCTILW